MAIVLVILALGSVLAGYVGVPAALGGNNWIEHYLHPSFVAHGVGGEHRAADRSSSHVAMARAAPRPANTAAEALRQSPRRRPRREGRAGSSDHVGARADADARLEHHRHSAASASPGTSSSAGRAPPTPWPRAPRPLHRLLLNKYDVDEIYDAAIVQPIKRVSTGLLWKGVDAGVIDGAVNGTGAFVGAGSSVLRRLQTGSVRAYAVSVFLGVVTVLGYYMWRF